MDKLLQLVLKDLDVLKYYFNQHLLVKNQKVVIFMALQSPPNNNKNIFNEIEGGTFMVLKPPPNNNNILNEIKGGIKDLLFYAMAATHYASRGKLYGGDILG
eukprot:61685_1